MIRLLCIKQVKRFAWIIQGIRSSGIEWHRVCCRSSASGANIDSPPRLWNQCSDRVKAEANDSMSYAVIERTENETKRA